MKKQDEAHEHSEDISDDVMNEEAGKGDRGEKIAAGPARSGSHAVPRLEGFSAAASSGDAGAPAAGQASARPRIVMAELVPRVLRISEIPAAPRQPSFSGEL